MKIYFAGSIRGGRENIVVFRQIIGFSLQFGQVLTEHIGDEKVDDLEAGSDDNYIHDRDIRWLSESDVVIAEVTTPSLGVGYEIRSAIEMGKPVLCLFRKTGGTELSAMINGCSDLKVVRYADIQEAYSGIKEFLECC